jgi:hypothetical protein
MTIDFERRIRELTQPINGQYPRPWMTDLTNPLEARVFLVGLNQATTYPAERRKSEADFYERFIDALFNRNGETCRALYREVRQGKTSRTRSVIEDLIGRLAAKGIHAILETNVVCYSTPRGGDLDLPEHSEGKERGKRIFRVLLEEIQPPILIVHGKRARELLGYTLGAELPERPKCAEEHPSVVRVDYCRKPDYRPLVFVIRSLSPQDFNTRWGKWTPDPLKTVAMEVERWLRP